MTDLHIDSKPRRSGFPHGSGELQRRNDLRKDRRTFRSWPLLPVPAVRASGGHQVAPAVDWSHGDTMDGAEDWQDRPDERDLGGDFAPAPEASLWRESIEYLQVATRSRALAMYLMASVVLHLVCAVFLAAMPAQEAVEIAGGGAVSVMLVGEQAFDSLAMGKADGEGVAQPVEETNALETTERPQEATTTRELGEASEIEKAVSEPLSPSAQLASSLDAESVETLSPPEQTAQAVSEMRDAIPAEAVASAESFAIDSSSVSETGELMQAASIEPRTQMEVEKAAMPLVEPIELQEVPKPTRQTGRMVLERKLATPKKVEKPKTEGKKVAARKQAEAEREAKSAPARSRKGDGGEAKANSQRGASATSNSQTSSDPGNAAVTNYPGKVAAKLRRALKYPKSAVSGSRGETQVAFTVLADGSATGVRVVASSGSSVLDQAAMDAVKRASPFPPIPADAGRKQWPFAVPVLFRR